MRARPCDIKTYNALQYVVDSTVLIIHHDAVAYASGIGVSIGVSSAGSRSMKKLDRMSRPATTTLEIMQLKQEVAKLQTLAVQNGSPWAA